MNTITAHIAMTQKEYSDTQAELTRLRLEVAELASLRAERVRLRERDERLTAALRKFACADNWNTEGHVEGQWIWLFEGPTEFACEAMEGS